MLKTTIVVISRQRGNPCVAGNVYNYTVLSMFYINRNIIEFDKIDFGGCLVYPILYYWRCLFFHKNIYFSLFEEFQFQMNEKYNSATQRIISSSCFCCLTLLFGVKRQTVVTAKVASKHLLKRQYFLTCKVSRYCILALHGSAAFFCLCQWNSNNGFPYCLSKGNWIFFCLTQENRKKSPQSIHPAIYSIYQNPAHQIWLISMAFIRLKFASKRIHNAIYFDFVWQYPGPIGPL